ncbi:hypothetical protein, partial [Achromobacter xylosoxidans]|uniref:hypothetical protein n=1 Tax=Alcaligenes xylosoxydans xylosoxydans TaxID=85698 RepID=UPI001EED35CA
MRRPPLTAAPAAINGIHGVRRRGGVRCARLGYLCARRILMHPRALLFDAALAAFGSVSIFVFKALNAWPRIG